MAGTTRQSDPRIGFEPDPVLGFAYDRELPPDVPPGMTLAQWRRLRHREPVQRPPQKPRRPLAHCHLHRPQLRLHVHRRSCQRRPRIVTTARGPRHPRPPAPQMLRRIGPVDTRRA